jgi:tetratricopeptide (TPR) repeat protein
VTIGQNRTGFIALLVGAATLLVYSGALSCGFINLDDPFYITNNPLIRSLDPVSLLRLFTESHLAAWLPLTYLSFAVDYHFWGLNPYGYHLNNILLHAINAMLVVVLCDRVYRTMYPDAVEIAEGGRLHMAMLLLAGLLFSLHPLRVESVAWAAERKDVLNGLFTLSAILAYLGYVRRKAAGEGRPLLLYLLALGFFLLSLMAKQVSVTLPVILLLLDWYPLARLQRGRIFLLFKEKVPFFLVSLLITFVTIFFAVAEKKLISMASMPFLVRLVVSGNAIFDYLRFFLVPVGINPYFVLPKPLPYGYSLKAALVFPAVLLLLRYAGRFRGTATVWLSYLTAIAPMLAFVQAGDDIAIAARYTYLPLIAPAIGAAILFRRLCNDWLVTGKRLRVAALGLLVTVFLFGSVTITLKLVPVWRDTGAFWSRVIAIAPVGRAYGDRGVYYLINGRSAEAVEDFNMAIEIAVRSGIKSVYNLYAFRGVALSDTGHFAEAVADFDRAIGIYPHPTYFQQRGIALKALGRETEAAEDFRRAGSNPPAIDWFEQEKGVTNE